MTIYAQTINNKIEGKERGRVTAEGWRLICHHLRQASGGALMEEEILVIVGHSTLEMEDW